tara:strand:+ start:21535 stop:22185 length:651 start_codon:yes stop_codon:yes gene_type:complete
MIEKIIRRDFVPATLKDSAINTLAIMEEFKISELPVVDENNKFLGLIEEDSILNMENLQASLMEMRKNLKNIFLFSNAHFFQCIQMLAENNLSIIPVLDSKKLYSGYISPSDVIGKIGELNYDNSFIITISVNKKDFMIHETSRLIEENNGKIMAFFSEMKKEKIYIHFLINCNNNQLITQTLSRYDYEIIDTFSPEIKRNELDDRFESFIKYLNT